MIKYTSPYTIGLVVLLCTFVIGPLFGQNEESRFEQSKFIYSYKVLLKDWNGNLTLPFKNPFPSNQSYKIDNASLFITFSTGEDYRWGSADKYGFEVDLNLSYTLNNQTVPIAFKLSNDHPQVMHVQGLQSNWLATPLSFQTNALFSSISNNLVNSELNTSSTLFSEFKNELLLTIGYEIDYAIDVKNPPNPITTNSVQQLNGRRYRFNWNPGFDIVPGYQIQILRLFNQEATIQNELERIKIGPLDWSNAFSHYIESNARSVDLDISEGSGFYVWRVRPIGSYYRGGLANDQNFGAWSWAPVNQTLALDTATIRTPFFFFYDPDDDKNWVYSRAFTEEGKVHSYIIFANGLLQTQQKQSYLPSKDSTLITQTISDYSGRAAITTLPVPVPNQQGLTYYPGFVKTAGSSPEPYSAKHFDKDENYRNPTRMNDAPQQSKLAYYSSTNPDQQIPDAEGYPFQRTLFSNDGTGRVAEQSGVGKMHMIAEDRQGKGKTAKTLYALPSEIELVRLFGNEAPNHESVRKIINIDPNDVATIQYITNTGKVIATAISYVESEGSKHLLPIDTAFAKLTSVTDVVKKSIRTEKGLMSSKRFAILKKSPLSVDYTIPCLVLQEGCISATLDCGYTLTLILHNLSEGTSRTIATEEISSKDCINGVISINKNEPDLLPGEYLLEKYLTANRPPQVKLQADAEEVLKKVTPLTDLIQSWIAQVNTVQKLEELYKKVVKLSNEVNSGNIPPEYKLPADFVLAEQKMHLSGALTNPQSVSIVSSCCTIDIPLRYTPISVCEYVTDANGQINVSKNAFMSQGFSKYAVDFLAGSGCLQSNNPVAIAKGLLFQNEDDRSEDVNDFLNDYFSDVDSSLMKGWTETQFDEMIYNMLTDVYAGQIGEPAKVQYTCEHLMNSWLQVLIMLREQICNQQSFAANEPNGGNVSDQVDTRTADQDQQSGENTHDKHMDSGGGIVGFFVSIVSALARGNDGEIKFGFHPVDAFFQRAGYRFAGILTPRDHLPPGYTASWISPKTKKGKAIFYGIKNPIFAYKYFHYNFEAPELEVTSCFRHPDSCYSNGRVVPCCYNSSNQPIPCEYCTIGTIKCTQTYRDWSFGQRYAFYEKLKNYSPSPESERYQVAGRVDYDWKFICRNIKRTYPELVTLCDLLELNVWSISDIIENKLENPVNLYVDSDFTYLKEKINDEVVHTTIIGEVKRKMELECRQACLNKRAAIKDSVLLELKRKCYQIDECGNNHSSLTMNQVDKIVDELLKQCIEKCQVSSANIRVEYICRPTYIPVFVQGYNQSMLKYPSFDMGVGSPSPGIITLPVSFLISNRDGGFFFNVYAENHDQFTYSDAIAYDQAMNWFIQVSLPSKCADVPPANCNTTAEPSTTLYNEETRARVRPRIMNELDFFTTDKEIIPTLKSASQHFRLELKKQ